MAFRHPASQLSRRVAGSIGPLRSSSALWPAQTVQQQLRCMATPVQAKQNAQGTAIVLLNMGGPSTTDEVGSFLSRLFVRVNSFPAPLRSY